MALSEREQQLLDELERHLYGDTAPRPAPTESSAAPALSLGQVVRAVLAGAAGLGIILAGIALGQPLIGVAGFAVMVVAVSAALVTRRRGADQRSARESGTAAPRRAEQPARGRAETASGPRQSFMEKLDERWDRRQQGL